VRTGRRAEFVAHGWSPEDFVDPQDPATFEASRLDWAELEKDQHQELFGWYRQLIDLRRAHMELTDGRLDRVKCDYDDDSRWFVLYRGRLAIACNLADHRQSVPMNAAPTGVLLSSSHGFVFRPDEIELEPESVAVVTLAL
jgi:maltooligosyltrehalose trehalohydrolase